MTPEEMVGRCIVWKVGSANGVIFELKTYNSADMTYHTVIRYIPTGEWIDSSLAHFHVGDCVVIFLRGYPNSWDFYDDFDLMVRDVRREASLSADD